MVIVTNDKIDFDVALFKLWVIDLAVSLITHLLWQC